MPTLTRPCRLESLRSEFGGLQLKDELDRQGKQKKLFGKAQKIFNKQVKSKHDKMEDGLEKELAEQARDHAKCVQASEQSERASKASEKKKVFAAVRREWASEAVGGGGAKRVLSCGWSGQAMRLSGGDPPEPPLRPARSHRVDERASGAMRLSGGDPPNPPAACEVAPRYVLARTMCSLASCARSPVQ
jgi:hypothetical protein